jgi:ribonucleoside-diphosphate reductase alpha chain
VPLDVLVDKFSYSSFEPSGMTGNPAIRFAKSPLDYVFRWLGTQFLETTSEPEPTLENAPLPPEEKPRNQAMKVNFEHHYGGTKKRDGHVCMRCGNPAQRAGACVTCPTCGWSEGCG